MAAIFGRRSSRAAALSYFCASRETETPAPSRPFRTALAWGLKTEGRVAHKPPMDAAGRCKIVERVRLGDV